MASGDNKKIAVNTIILYLRMIIIMIITLYTSRVVLSALGQDNFGIYNLIGGIVVLFSFITNAMTSSTQRFLNYYTGIQDNEKIIRVFNSAKIAHYIILVTFFILSETIGLWFVETQLNIPANRFVAARWVYQTSVISAIFGIVVIPYRAAIIAQERMSIFAYISIIEVLLKLVIALILPLLKKDLLITYSILFSIISILSFYAHKISCSRLFDFTKAKQKWDRQQLKELLSFSGWYLLGGMAMVSSRQGINILINIFYNVALNAAVGISNQVRTAIYNFVSNFQTAFNPQIVSLYASKDYNSLFNLIYRATKFSYYLMFVLSLPIIIYCSDILNLWLTIVPSYSVSFTQLVIISSFFEALSAPLWTTIGATGRVRTYQIIVSVIILIDLPLTYLFLKLGFNPNSVFIINVLVNISAYIYRILCAKKLFSLSIKQYIYQSLLPCLKISIASIVLAFLFNHYVSDSLLEISGTTIRLIINVVILFAIITAMVWILGLNTTEKKFIIQVSHKFISK